MLALLTNFDYKASKRTKSASQSWNDIENLLRDALAVAHGVVSFALLGVWDWWAYLLNGISYADGVKSKEYFKAWDRDQN